MSNLPVPIPRTFTVGETESGAYLNTLRDALNFLLNPPMAVLTQATLQSIPTGAGPFAITFDSTVIDSYGGHSNSTNNSRYTGQVPGWYYVLGVHGTQANGNGQRSSWIAKNGSVLTYSLASVSPASSGSAIAPQAGALVFLNGTTDYVELYISQTSGVALNTVAANCSLNVFWMHS